MKWKSKQAEGPAWPSLENGTPVPPAFLMHIHGKPMEMELTLNLLQAYGIPYNCEYPNNGLFGSLIMGFPPGGMDVYVPESMLQDAESILSAEIQEDDDL